MPGLFLGALIHTSTGRQLASRFKVWIGAPGNGWSLRLVHHLLDQSLTIQFPMESSCTTQLFSYCWVVEDSISCLYETGLLAGTRKKCQPPIIPVSKTTLFPSFLLLSGCNRINRQLIIRSLPGGYIPRVEKEREVLWRKQLAWQCLSTEEEKERCSGSYCQAVVFLREIS